jgi:hypothetical protein
MVFQFFLIKLKILCFHWVSVGRVLLFPELCAKMIYFFQVCKFGEDKVGINFSFKRKKDKAFMTLIYEREFFL